MTTISLKEFLIKGHFGNVRLGMTESKVISEIGIPQDQGNYGDQAYSLFYGEYEFFFDSDSKELTGVQNDHLVTNNQDKRQDIIGFENDQFTLDTWILDKRRNTEFHEVLTHIKSEGIAHRIEETDFENIINFNGGACMSFSDQDSGIESENKTRDVIDGTIQNRHQFLLNGIHIYK